MAKTVVILGASLAGVPIAHHLLKHTAPLVPGLRIILVSPNTHMFWNLASVRGILPDMLDDDKYFIPLAPAFAKYPSDRFEFVVGKAESLDPAKSLVTVSTNDGRGRKIQYDTLVIAAGTSFKEGMPFKNLSSTDETRDAIHSWQQKIGKANSIVIAGAGTTGVELAGELGQEYGLPGTKQITIISSDELPLASKLKRDVRETAKAELERMNVRFVGNSKVIGVSDSAGGQMSIEVVSTSGKKQSIKADLFIPTYGVTPNSSFLPAHMLDSRGFVKQTSNLQAEGYQDIFVVGDIGSLQAPQAKNTDDQVVHVVKSLQAHLTGGEVAPYEPEDKIMLGVSLGRKGGTGQMGNWRPWSWLLWFFKSRYLGTDYAGEFANGLRTIQAKKWA